MQESIPCSIYRGGTSRGLILDEALVPPPGAQRDQLLIALMGGPDAKQINGLGGGQVTTSKAALIRPSQRPGVDVDYTFAQVVVGQNAVDYKANCGNISSAVGPYAIENGLVAARDGVTPVTIYNTNTQKTIVALVETPGGKVTYEGDFAISGVDGTGSKIELRFLEPGGAATGSLLPTGSALDRIPVPGLGEVEISVVDASNLFVFVPAQAVGLRGNELPAALDANGQAIAHLENIRGIIAQRLGYVDDYRDAFEKTPSVPKLAVVSAASAYATTAGQQVAAEDMDVQIRMISMKKTHKTFAMTGGMCVAAACVVPGTVLHRLVDGSARFRPGQIVLAHPGGLMDVGVDAQQEEQGGVRISSASGFRTARLLMEGKAYYSGT